MILGRVVLFPLRVTELPTQNRQQMWPYVLIALVHLEKKDSGRQTNGQRSDAIRISFLFLQYGPQRRPYGTSSQTYEPRMREIF